MMEELYLTEVEKTAFPDLEAVICFYKKIPNRYKSINLLEPEYSNKPEYDDFDPRHPHRLWASIVKIIDRVLTDAGWIPRKVFEYWWIDDRDTERDMKEFAKELGCSKNYAYKKLYEVEDELTSIFVARGYMTPPPAYDN